jgi:hypothetical protein
MELATAKLSGSLESLVEQAKRILKVQQGLDLKGFHSLGLCRYCHQPTARATFFAREASRSA